MRKTPKNEKTLLRRDYFLSFERKTLPRSEKTHPNAHRLARATNGLTRHPSSIYLVNNHPKDALTELQTQRLPMVMIASNGKNNLAMVIVTSQW